MLTTESLPQGGTLTLDSALRQAMLVALSIDAVATRFAMADPRRSLLAGRCSLARNSLARNEERSGNSMDEPTDEGGL